MCLFLLSFYAAKVEDARFIERQLHDAFDDYRENKAREFFKVAPERVVSALKIAELEDVTPRMDIVESQEEQQALNKAREQRSRFNFQMVGIPKGSVLKFTKDDTMTAKVISHRDIEFDNNKMSLSAAAIKILNDMGYDWKQVQGPAYWSYDGDTLHERRMRMESE